MDYELRRLLPRQLADWRGRYIVEGDPEENWRDCRVVDISSAGAGVEVPGGSPEETEGHRIVLVIHLIAEVKYAKAQQDKLRVGLQFVELSDAERRYLGSLADLDARW